MSLFKIMNIRRIFGIWILCCLPSTRYDMSHRSVSLSELYLCYSTLQWLGAIRPLRLQSMYLGTFFGYFRTIFEISKTKNSKSALSTNLRIYPSNESRSRQIREIPFSKLCLFLIVISPIKNKEQKYDCFWTPMDST